MFLFLVLTTNAKAQPVTWSKWFDYNNYDNSGQDVIQTFDGGYLILGINYNSLNNSSILIKINSLGTIVWKKIIDQTMTQGVQVTCYALHQVNDSGFILSGFSSSDSAVLLKTDKIGNISWIKKYSRIGVEARFFDHKITSDGGIIACGDLYPPFKAYVVKTDSNGNKEWDSSYSLVSSNILQSDENNYYILSTNSISKIDFIGRLIWTRGLGNIGNKMIQQNPGELYTIYTGNNLDSLLLNKIDSSGNLLWRKSYFPVTRGFSLCFSKEGNILLAGYKDTLKQFDIVTAKINLDGSLIYRKRINVFTGNLFMYPNSVKGTNDYGFIFTGPTDYPGSPYQDNIFALKTDSLCNAPIFTVINTSATELPKNFQLLQNYPNPFNGFTTINYELKSSGLTNLSICDISGKEIFLIRNEHQNSGFYQLKLNSDILLLSSGIYFVKLNFNKDIDVRKIVLLK